MRLLFIANPLYIIDEDIDDYQIHPKRKAAVKKYAEQRTENPYAQFLNTWFPEDQERIVIPIDPTEDFVKLSKSSYHNDPQQHLNQLIYVFDLYGFRATAKSLENNIVYDHNDQRSYRVSKAIDMIKKKMRIPLGYKGDDYINGFGRVNDPDLIVRNIERRWKSYLDQMSYENTSNKKDTDQEKWAIISRNICDIATMSTDRPWVSCMSLNRGEGEYSPKLYQDLKNGMLVAYMIIGSEQEAQRIASEIAEPIPAKARIAIKPFRQDVSRPELIDKNHPIAQAWPESEIYHEERVDTRGFYEAVVKWVRSKLDPESHKIDWGLTPGGYTDSLDSAIIANYSEKDIQRMFMQKRDISIRPVEMNAIKLVLSNPKGTYNRQTLQLIKSAVLADAERHGIRKTDYSKRLDMGGYGTVERSDIDTLDKVTLALIKKYPEIFTRRDLYTRVSPFVRERYLELTSRSIDRAIEQQITNIRALIIAARS